MKKISFKKAVERFCEELRSDSGLYYAYQANIAMAFYDEYRRNGNNLPHREVIKVANQAAKNFLNLLINDDD